MLKTWGHIILLSSLPLLCFSQKQNSLVFNQHKSLDSLQLKLRSTTNDSILIIAYERLGHNYERLNIDSSLKYFGLGLNLARQKQYSWAEARLLAGLSGVMEHQGNFAEELELLFQSLKIAQESRSAFDIARANRRISGVYFELEDYPNAIAYILKALQIDEANQLEDKAAIDHYTLADCYEKINMLDSADFHISLAISQKNYLKGLMQYVYQIDGHIRQKTGSTAQAFQSYNLAFKEAQQSSDLLASSMICADISRLYIAENLSDSSIFYATKGYNYAKEVAFKKGIMANCNLLAELYDSSQPALALSFYKIAAAAKESLYGINNIQTIQNLIARETAKQKELEVAQLSYKNRLKLYGLIAGLTVLLIIAFILYRNNRQKQKANVMLLKQNEKIEKTLNELKVTQKQLIQSEKMASLGELTAGIAHEIQNPLNFVNNFSEVSNELLDEMKVEQAAGNWLLATEISDDLKSNLEKILHHGKRAEGIVKGMLQHSRASSGKRELTDINALCDEYLRLSYHGLRAKDKSFNSKFETDFDPSLPRLNVVPQDIGRVVLNLINNAFYAVSERLRQARLPDKQAQPDSGYEPAVTVSTSYSNESNINGIKPIIKITVKDNGNGIPDTIKEKIFQPFFTTKPTGQGTGLGLSLSYDSVKAHGGELKVETKEGEGSEFIILLPVV